MKIAVIVDSTACLKEETEQHPDLFQVNLSVNMPDGSVVDDTIEAAWANNFYEKIGQLKTLPTTSQPVPGDYYQLYEQIESQGYDTVIGVFLLSTVSGTYQGAVTASQAYEGDLDFHLFDSKTSISSLGYLADQILAIKDSGLSLDDILSRVNWLIDHVYLNVVVEDLSYFVKGGRVKASTATIGNLLRIKPLLEIDEALELSISELVRTTKRVYKRWLELIDEAHASYPAGFKLAHDHVNALGEVEEFLKLVRSQFPNLEISVHEVGPVLSTHAGPGARAINILPSLDNFRA